MKENKILQEDILPIHQLIEKVLGIPEHGDSPRADLMLPNQILYIGICILVIGILLLISCIFDFSSSKVLAALLVILFAVMTVIWWRNTTITITSTHTFVVSNIFGKTKEFRFDEISGYQRSYNFVEISVGSEKFKIEDTSLMTQRLRTLLNKALNKEVFK